MFSHKHHECHVRKFGDPRVTDELQIEGKQSLGIRRIATGCCLPVDHGVLVINLPEGIKIGHEFAPSRQCPKHFDLQVLLWIANPNAIIPCKRFEQMDPWWKRRSQDSPLRNSKEASRYASHSLKSTAALSSWQKYAPRAFSKQRPKTIAARVSFSR